MSISEKLKAMFAEKKYAYAILFPSTSPTTTKHLLVEKKEDVNAYFDLMLEAELISYYARNKTYDGDGGWQMIFETQSGVIGYANVHELSYCKV